MNKKYHYTYIITCTDTNKKYYGVRSCDCLPSEDIYLGSSKYLTEDIEKLGKSKFIKEIDKTFESRADANEYERLYILNDKLHLSEDWYNKTVPPKSGEFFNTAGENNPMFGKSCRDNMSEAEILDLNAKISLGLQAMSEEDRLQLEQKLSICRTNQYAVNVNGTINIVNGQKEVAKFLNCSIRHVRRVISGWIAPERSKLYNIFVTIHKQKNPNNPNKEV